MFCHYSEGKLLYDYGNPKAKYVWMAFCDVQFCFNELNIVYSITNECICNIETQDFHWLIPQALVKTKILFKWNMVGSYKWLFLPTFFLHLCILANVCNDKLKKIKNQIKL